MGEHRKLAPDDFPSRPLKRGEVGTSIPVTSEQLTRLFRSALTPAGKPNRVVWYQGDSEVLVDLQRTRVEVVPGLVLVGMGLETTETGPGEVTVPFAVGTAERLSGMVAVTEPRPRGPGALVDRWGDSVIALAWRTLIDVSAIVAALAGFDDKGSPLRPGALLAEQGRLVVVAQAAHPFERRGAP